MRSWTDISRPSGVGIRLELLGAEGVAVEGGGALGALDDDVRSDRHARNASAVAASPVLDVLAVCRLARMATEQVRMWRPADEDRVLLMAGRTTRYAIEPRGEYVFGIVGGQPMRSRRGRERRLVRPASSSPGIPPSAHAGAAVDGRPWSSRLMVVEVADLAALAGDEETDAPGRRRVPRAGALRPRARARLPAAARARSRRRPRGSSATSGSRSGCAR